MSRFHTIEDARGQEFYQLPKDLIKNPKYKKLTANAKIAYAILKDRHSVSLKNKWIDDEGRVYFLFSDSELADLLDMSIRSTNRFKNELQDYELIHMERQGLNRRNKIYLLKPEFDNSVELTGEVNEIKDRTKLSSPDAPILSGQDKTKLASQDTPILSTLSNTDLSNTDFKEKKDEEDYIYIGDEKKGVESYFSQTLEIELPTGMDKEEPKTDNQPLERKRESKSINQSASTKVDDQHINKLRSENLTFDFIYDFLTDKGLTKDTIYNVINQCHENGMDLVTAKEVEKQYQHMMGKVRNEESIYDFSSYFVGGLKRRMELAVASRTESQEEEARALLKGVKKVPLYNWLEERA